jgi:hypothetical protein
MSASRLPFSLAPLPPEIDHFLKPGIAGKCARMLLPPRSSRRLRTSRLQDIPQCRKPSLEFVHAPPETRDLGGQRNGIS